MKSVSIGYTREDGDFAILATLNNKDGGITHYYFQSAVETLRWTLSALAERSLEILEREDTPDYVELEE